MSDSLTHIPGSGVFAIPLNSFEPDTLVLLLNCCVKYGIMDGADNPWSAIEALYVLAYEVSDFETIHLLNGIATARISPLCLPDDSDVAVDSEAEYTDNREFRALSPSEVKSNALIDTTLIYDDVCPIHNFDLSVDCANETCQFFSPECDYKCSHSKREEMNFDMTFEAIAHRLGIDSHSCRETYQSAISKLYRHYAPEMVEPKYDFVQVEGKCALCKSSLEESDYLEVEDHYQVCDTCTGELTLPGAQLVLRFKSDLKTIIETTGKQCATFHIQSSLLEVGITVLQNLYNLTGVYRRGAQAAAHSLDIMTPRSSKSVLLRNSSYLTAEVIAAKNIFGGFSEEALADVSKLSDLISSKGMDTGKLLQPHVCG